jgi:superfamily II DNA or RNA helicase
MICSPDLSAEDVAAMDKGYEQREIIGEALCRSIQKTIEQSVGLTYVEFLATLIAVGCLDIKIAFRPGAHGVFHDKLGVFSDNLGHSVSFTGSSNETEFAWDPSGNHESFDVFRSWTDESSRVALHSQYFTNLWSGIEPGVETLLFPQVAKERLSIHSNDKGVMAAFEEISRSDDRQERSPLPHQIQAIESWKANGKSGILEHATGSGKTYTALLAAREHLSLGMPVMVLVPSDLLLQQWKREVRLELQSIDPKLLEVGGGNSRWKSPGIVEGFTSPEGGARITIATMQSVSSPGFLERIHDGSHLFLVADEVHRIGSPVFSRILTVNAGPRLGLSATPRRYGDPEGTKRTLNYFGGVLQPPFTIEDAIAAGRLCRYTYHVHEVNLTDTEAEEWRDLTKQIKHNYAKLRRTNDGEVLASEYVRLLQIQRARIAKGARMKSELAARVLSQHFRPGQRWLVYCDTQSQLIDVRQALRDADLTSDEYHSAMIGDRGSTMDYFENMGGILVAIRCLDEGVDIPAVDHALILASSKNPREFIQRRGRVLRTFPRKYFARIHDALVLPPRGDFEPDELALLRGEMARALRFSNSAVNDSVSFYLRKLCSDYGIDPDGTIASVGFEDEEDIDGKED